MNNDIAASNVGAEGTALPPARAFGDTCTLTVPRTRRRRTAADLANAAATSDGAAALHVAVVPADRTPITLTV